MMKPRMSAERPCQHCGKSLGDDAAAHVCEADPELRATKADTPSGLAAGAAGTNGKKAAQGPTSGRVTAQVAADPDGGLVAAPTAAPASAVADLAQKLAVAAAAARKSGERPAAPPIEEDEGYDPAIGTLLGEHYRVIERLGRGGMGTVYLVTHIHLKKKFAAKILNTETAQRADALARFQQEAVAASKLDHENIVDIVNFGTSEDGTPYLIMEFLRGEPLNQI